MGPCFNTHIYTYMREKWGGREWETEDSYGYLPLSQIREGKEERVREAGGID